MSDALFAQSEIRGEFTGERLFKSKPEIYRSIVSAYSEGLSIRQCARAFAVSTNTVMAVLARERATIETGERKTVASLKLFGRLAAERLLDEVDKIPLQSLPVAMGIAIDKAQLLGGEATARVEHVVPKGGHDAFNRVVDLLPEDVQEMGLSQRESGQKSAAALPGAAPLAIEGAAVGSDDARERGAVERQQGQDEPQVAAAPVSGVAAPGASQRASEPPRHDSQSGASPLKVPDATADATDRRALEGPAAEVDGDREAGGEDLEDQADGGQGGTRPSRSSRAQVGGGGGSVARGGG